MSNFAYPEWLLPPGYYDPPPPPDPETRRDLDTQVEEGLNGFIEARQRVLHLEPDAYFRKRGRDAVEGVDAINERLNKLKTETIARAATDYERRALEERTSALIGLDQGDIRRHVRSQLKEWQRQAMTRRIELMRKQAGFNWKDRGALQTYADAAESAARDHGWADGLAPDSVEVQGRVQATRSGVLRSAVEGALNGNHLADAIALYEQISPHLAPDDVQAIGPQIDYARELETGHGYVAPFIKTLPDDLDEIDAAHRAALERNAVDWPNSPSQHATNRYLIDRAFSDHRHNITQRRADLDKQIEAWIDQRQPGDSPWPPRRLWVQLDPDQRQQVYERLKFKTSGATEEQDGPVQSIASNVEPPPGSSENRDTLAQIVPDDAVGASMPPTDPTGQLPVPIDDRTSKLAELPVPAMEADDDGAGLRDTIDDRTSPDQAGGRRIVHGRARPPTRRGGPPLSRIEEMRIANFKSHLEAIRAIEPNNPNLIYVTRKGWVPTQRDVDRIHEELLKARQREAKREGESGIGVGRYAGESIPARSPDRIFADERLELNRIGRVAGCHTCGTKHPQTRSGNFVGDHQDPSSLAAPGALQRLYPQCLTCSLRQGGLVKRKIRREKE